MPNRISRISGLLPTMPSDLEEPPLSKDKPITGAQAFALAQRAFHEATDPNEVVKTLVDAGLTTAQAQRAVRSAYPRWARR